MPRTGGYAKWLDANLIPGYAWLEGVLKRLDALSCAGLTTWSSKGYPRLKRNLEASRGKAASDFLGDIQSVNNRSSCSARSSVPAATRVTWFWIRFAAVPRPASG